MIRRIVAHLGNTHLFRERLRSLAHGIQSGSKDSDHEKSMYLVRNFIYIGPKRRESHFCILLELSRKIHHLLNASIRVPNSSLQCVSDRFKPTSIVL